MKTQQCVFNLNRIVGRKIREFRKSMNMTQAELGKVIMLHQTAMARVESGHQKITAEQLYIFSLLFNKPMVEFFEEEQQKEAA